MSKHPVGDLDAKLRVARPGRDNVGWLVSVIEPPKPLALALTQAAPDFDPFADPKVAKSIEDARAAAETRGLKEGADKAEADRQKLGEIIAGISAAIEAATARDCEAIASLALAVAEGLLGRELDGDSAALQASVADAIGRLSDEGTLALRAHPLDHSIIEECGELSGTSLIADATLRRGEFLIESPSSILDARAKSRLEPLREELCRLALEDNGA